VSSIKKMLVACWITKATNTHSEYVILIAFPRQQWLSERASMLRYTYIACVVFLRTTWNTYIHTYIRTYIIWTERRISEC